MSDQALLEQAREYVLLDFNPITKNIIQGYITERNIEELTKLMPRMEFGTAGLRFENLGFLYLLFLFLCLLFLLCDFLCFHLYGSLEGLWVLDMLK